MYAVLATCGCVEAAPGLEQWRGPDVQIDVLPEPLRVNGMPFIIHRASGKGVGLLAHSIGRQWIKEEGDEGIRSATQGGWMVLSRIHDQNLEVLQWRGTGADAEMLWSSSSMRAQIRKPPPAAVRLPVGCISGLTVHGDMDIDPYIQRTAQCSRAPRAIISASQAIARKQGFTIQSLGDFHFLARRQATEVTILASENDPSGLIRGSTLVYLQVDRRGRLP